MLLHDFTGRIEVMEYRGIIHNHSACSKEGCYALPVLRRRWEDSLDFAAMTEHAERTNAADYTAYIQQCDALSDELHVRPRARTELFGR